MNIHVAAGNSITLVFIIVAIAVTPVAIYAIRSWFKDRNPW